MSRSPRLDIAAALPTSLTIPPSRSRPPASAEAAGDEPGQRFVEGQNSDVHEDVCDVPPRCVAPPRIRSCSNAMAVAAALAIILAACSGGETSTDPDLGPSTYNGAIGKVVRETDVTGGTLRMARSGDDLALDPGDSYDGSAWNLMRNYARTLVAFKAAPGEAGTTLVPDLATSLGAPSDEAKTWTYTLRPGLKYEDGSAITSTDIKYAVARQLDKNVLANGYFAFNDMLSDLPPGYSVYSDKNLDNLKSIETPDEKTIVFHLSKPFAGFDYLAQMPATAPVPQAKDTGASYQEKVISSGPYKFGTIEPGKQFTLIRNEEYDPKTDPDTGRKPLVDRIEVALNVDAAEIERRLMAGDLDVGDIVDPATQAQLQTEPEKSRTDSPIQPDVRFTVINTDVAPLDNADCRKAVQYAVDKTAYQRAYGGTTGADIATSLLPPVIPGHRDMDLYNAKTHPGGDLDQAKAALSACGKPDGFQTNAAYRTKRPEQKAGAEALQQSLARVGIKLTLKPYPAEDYAPRYADRAKADNLGLNAQGWGSTTTDPYFFLHDLVDSRAIVASDGNANLGVRIPAVDAMIDTASRTTDQPAREKIWGDIDEAVMKDATVFPGVWSKLLLYRPDNLTNVFVNQAFGTYDYAAIGTSRK